MTTAEQLATRSSTPACDDGVCGAAGMTVPDSERTAAVFKALADPVRLRLYSRIAATGGETCVCDIQDVGVSQPTVSHHLRKLRDAGLIDCERRGTWVYYWAVPGALGPLASVLDAHTQLITR
ncbi:ArsR/SmtB family transcription factor [Nakamurella aerolata]|uniref:Helix-turn-helix transcriptional regulator n=1 Tax=Nakamurella aerolata TaxID=1656892 RepID=A0A849A9C9_9ACTN|nr:metalloregulator ArsR/SmtB family transcription factor [Nakamurella aerolata]NNG35090.1 helix-turn-helix transcriptional regulator [Nakamurella aerolata]